MLDVPALVQVKRTGHIRRAGSAPILPMPVETYLMYMVVAQHRRIEPLHAGEIQRVLRNTAIKLRLCDKRGKLYTEDTDVRHLYHNFMARMKQSGLNIAVRSGHSMGVQRAFACSREALQNYVQNVSASPCLRHAFYACC